MKELKVKENNTELKIEINGEPQYTKLSELDKSMLANKYEKVVFEIFEKYPFVHPSYFVPNSHDASLYNRAVLSSPLYCCSCLLEV